MLHPWTDTLANHRKAAGALATHHPKMLAAFRALSEALGTVIALNAGAAYVYSLRAMDALAEFEG